MTEIGDQVRNILWDDFNAENTFPSASPLLAHYTSIKSLESIVSNEELWFSHPLFMNDLEELQFGMFVGTNAFRYSDFLKNSLQNDVFAKLVQHFDKLNYEFETNHSFDTYVLSFSEHNLEDYDGVLSMWRAYGANGDGAALVFDTSKIELTKESPFIVGQVYYANQSQRAD